MTGVRKVVCAVCDVNRQAVGYTNVVEGRDCLFCPPDDSCPDYPLVLDVHQAVSYDSQLLAWHNATSLDAVVDMDADSSRSHRARSLFVSRESNDIQLTSLEGLGAELSSRWSGLAADQSLGQAIREKAARAKALCVAIAYASERLTDMLVRLQLVEWMKTVLAYETDPDVFAQAQDPKAASWRMYMGLAVKDFHIDIASLMDALAVVVIHAGPQLKREDGDWLPGWRSIRLGSDGPYRKQLGDDLRGIVDSTERWWPGVKNVRDLLTHRKHHRIIFGNSEDGLLFQVYDRSRSPEIVLPAVLYREGRNVVDFDLYSAFVVVEVLTLIDDLGNAIASRMDIAPSAVRQMYLRVVAKPLAQSIDRLIHVVG